MNFDCNLNERISIYAERCLRRATPTHFSSLEIFERIGNVQTQAMTLWWLGGLAEQQGEYTKAISCLQPALEILQKLKSPDAERVQAMLERIQNHS